MAWELGLSLPLILVGRGLWGEDVPKGLLWTGKNWKPKSLVILSTEDPPSPVHAGSGLQVQMSTSNKTLMTSLVIALQG